MEKKKQGIVITSVLLVCLIFVVIGVSFAFFTYSRQGSKENTITTGSLTFVYDEKEAEGNGITLSNAFPMSDDEGKQLSGSNNVFDFQVLASTKGESIAYEVIGKKEDSSTLPENVVKIYLTTLSGSDETEVATTVQNRVVTTYDELSDTQIEDQTGKTLYQEVIPLNQTGYQKNFRLRMWLSEEANTTTNGSWDYNNQTFTIRINVVANGEGKPIYQDPSGANSPELVEGMIPVIYDEEKSSWVKADIYNEWYDYNNQEWANAVTVTEENRATYMSAPVGTVISMNDINTMWVWIPRYEYQYDSFSEIRGNGENCYWDTNYTCYPTPGEINIHFLPKSITVSSDEEKYKISSAFTFGDKELSGFWYAKFETGGTLASACTDEFCNISEIVVKPSVGSLRNQTMSSFFYMARSMQMNSGNPYGFSSTTGDLHMSKNSEWGAVAYLSQSRYGKYGNSDYTTLEKEIAKNNCSDYITGIGGAGINDSATNATCTTNTYETTKGQAASTTGNITGVYDMSGGVSDSVMGGNDFSTFGTIDEKYYDRYYLDQVDEKNPLHEQLRCENNELCYGHALFETSGWYNDGQTSIWSFAPYFIRGSEVVAAWTNPGIFQTGRYGGEAFESIGTRLTFVTF